MSKKAIKLIYIPAQQGFISIMNEGKKQKEGLGMVEYIEDLEEEAHRHDNDDFLTLQKIEKLCVDVLPVEVTNGHAKYEFARKVLKIIWDDKIE